MKKLIPCMLAGFILVGLFSVCITSFLAPSSDYIQDTLEPTEEPFYITVNPQNTSLYVGDTVLLVARSNLADVSYVWQDYISADNIWASMPTSGLIDGCYSIRSLSPVARYMRCAISHGDRTIYSAPCLVVFKQMPKSSSSDLKSVNEEFEINSYFEDFEVSEVIK